MTFTDKEKKIVGIAYAVFMILFYFIGIPAHKGFLTYVVGFLVVSAVFAGFVWFVKKFFVDPR